MTDPSASSRATTPYPSPPNVMLLHAEGGDRNVQKLGMRFEESRDSPEPRPTTWSRVLSRSSSRLTGRGSRHVDVLEALFSSHRHRVGSAQTMSPTIPYNEDVAERNMTRFLRTQSKADLYKRFASALYQEDVASKNIAGSRKSSHSLSRPSSRSRSSVHGMNHSPQSTSRSSKRSSSGHPDSKRRDGQTSRAVSPDARLAREKWKRLSHSLRAQISEPNLTAENDASHALALSHSIGHLPALPAYNGNRLNRSPDNSTVPIPPRGVRNIYERRALSKSLTPKSNDTSSPTPRSDPRSNVPDLSINTELAARGKTTSKISHRAIQPPVPGNHAMKQNPSIAEVMNSPEETPSVSAAKVEEIMNMFRRAYVPTQAANATTYDTLQDVIVHEVNHHDAFQRVPARAPGPTTFTPPPSRDTFDRNPFTEKPSHPALRRSISAKDGQIAKLIKGGTSKRHGRGSEYRKSISTILPKSSDKISRLAPGSTRRRSHTDAPVPSAGLFDSGGSKQGNPDDQVMYMDLLMRSTDQPPSPFHDPTKNVSRSQSAALLPARKVPERIPSVYCLRAQSSASHENTPEDDSTNDLPSIETPRPQFHGIDKNNVKFIIQNSTPSDAQRLMNWPQRRNPHPSESDEEGLILNETDSFPLPPRSRSGPRLRVSRSLDAC